MIDSKNEYLLTIFSSVPESLILTLDLQDLCVIVLMISTFTSSLRSTSFWQIGQFNCVSFIYKFPFRCDVYRLTSLVVFDKKPKLHFGRKSTSKIAFLLSEKRILDKKWTKNLPKCNFGKPFDNEKRYV